MKHAEDLLVEKDRDYVQGFYDAIDLLNSHAQLIMDKTPENKRFGKLLAGIERLLCVAAEEHEDHVKKRFGINLEVEQEKEQHEETV